MNVAAYSGRYTAVQGTVYGKACKAFCDAHGRPPGTAPLTRLQKMANGSKAARRLEEGNQPTQEYRGHGTRQFLLRGDDQCIDLVDQDHRVSPLQWCEPSFTPVARAGLQEPKKTLRPVDQFHKVQNDDTQVAFDSKDVSRSAEAEA